MARYSGIKEREIGKIIGKLDSIHEDVGEIKKQLTSLNGKVQSNTINIKTMETAYKTDSKWVAKVAGIVGGGVSLIITIVGMIISFVSKK